MTHCREGAFNRVCGSDVGPVFRREIIKGEQFVFVPGQPFRRLRVFCLVFFTEHRQRIFRRQTALGPPDIVQVGLDLGLHGFRHIVQNIGRFVNPATLLAGRRKHFSKRRPETQSVVANRQQRCIGETTRFQINQKLRPALGAFPIAGDKAHQFLLALRCGPDNDQHTLALILHARLEIDPIGPDINIAPGR